MILGTNLDHKIIFSYMKRPIGPVIGILSQFIGNHCIIGGLWVYLSDRYNNKKIVRLQIDQ